MAASLLGDAAHLRGTSPMPGNEEKDMNFTQTARGIVRTIALVMSVAVPLAITISSADARVGGGGSSGSRGSRTYSAPPSTTTAPNAAQPMNRTFTQPGSPGMGAPAATGAAKGGFFNRPGMMGGMLGGLAMGFLGAGLFGMLFGGGLFSGLGGYLVDHRPAAADRPDHHRGAAGHVVVAAPPYAGLRLCFRTRSCRRWTCRRPRCPDQLPFGNGFWLGIEPARAGNPAGRL